jgi:hypothetical protein
MTRRGILFVAFMTMLLPLFAGCIVAERPGPGNRESYYYYPNDEVYYYPNVRQYYWNERGDWRHGPQPPPRFALRDRDRVRFDWNREPHNDHDRIRRDYPPGRGDKDRDGDRDKDRDKDRDRGGERDRPRY